MKEVLEWLKANDAALIADLAIPFMLLFDHAQTWYARALLQMDRLF